MYFVYHVFQVRLFSKTEICVITKTKIQTSKCLQLARFRSDPPQEITMSVKDACILQFSALQISYFF